ncbi:YihY/virulence factor BrkB family protein [Acetobacter sp. AN02]|uniref:YihY/virulence factor BrkB family protein n=1 Tax=Acetobacter sp. AN02 TaxID=2894186 RepID=UPI0024341F6F|nr:YihY/virulence factor BrkB family protein [Acetobacter sp. AN02]MDG6094113.1 YihY/virulence factor BrkB family protein [Acetobacter sp. AN02]
MTDGQALSPASDDSDAGGPASTPASRALSPLSFTLRDWFAIGRSTIVAAVSGPIMLVAAGCAFYTTLSLFPAISALISVYGLVFNVQDVAEQLNTIRRFVPDSAFSIIQSRINILVSEPHSSLTFGLLVTVSVALWSASASTKAILAALNFAYDRKEERSFFVFQLMALSLTLAAIGGASLSLALVVALPVMIHFLPYLMMISPPPGSVELAVRLGGLGVMLLFLIFANCILYKYGPSRKEVLWRWVIPGAVGAAFLWIILSAAFSFYVTNVAQYGSTYGPLSAIIALMMWFFVSAVVVLLGAEFNAEMEAQARGIARKLRLPHHLED